MKCTNCGAEISGSAKFCTNCGKAFNGAQYEQRICPSCGRAIESDDSFCSYCRVSLTNSGYDNTAVIYNRGEGKNKTNKTAPVYHKNEGKDTVGDEKVKTVIAVVGAAVIIIIVLTAGLVLSAGEGTAENRIGLGGAEQEEDIQETDSSLSSEDTDINTEDGFEEVIERIREEYGDIVYNITNGAYEEIEISSGIKAYYSENDLKAVIVSAGADNSDYIKTYYYSGGELICAYYEGDAAQRFYFSDGVLLRQRYFPDTSDVQNYVDYDTNTSSWEGVVLSESQALKEDWQNALLNLNSRNLAEESEQNGSSAQAEESPAAVPDSSTDTSSNSGSSPSVLEIEDEMAELMYNYCSNLCRAINTNNYSLAGKYIVSGSSLETSQKSLVSRLYSNGTTEELVSCNVTNVVSAGTNAYYVYVTETERINYVDKGTKTNTYNWKYTAVYTGGQWKLSNIEQA
ncbi:MAG: zinc ribbon domain-containing protein [Clostridiales bacterium]|nr:zinc ribbon domain-containing protein [Clostridiales bacterium]